MIPKNPQIGDIFIDDGHEYEVTGLVDYERFESRATGRFGLVELTEHSEDFTCQYCGKVCKNALGLSSHEKHCPSNPNKGGE